MVILVLLRFLIQLLLPVVVLGQPLARATMVDLEALEAEADRSIPLQVVLGVQVTLHL
jgi:hypothetical protein